MADLHINQGTYVSVGLLITIILGFAWVLKGQSETALILAKMDTRIEIMEKSKNSWTSTDMFKWAVHLQQANPQIKVPEPEVSTK